MLRWTLKILTVLSLLMCVAGSVLWVRSNLISDWITRKASFSAVDAVFSYDQRFCIFHRTNDHPSEFSHVGMDTWTWETRTRELESTRGFVREYATYADASTSIDFFGLRFLHAEKMVPRYWMLVVPYWFIVSLSAILPTWWFFRGRRTSKRYRRKHGLCPACGYDLQGSIGDCPECGAVAANNQPQKLTRHWLQLI